MAMYTFEIGSLKYRYVVGSYNCGIITPSRKRIMVLLADIQNPSVRVDEPKNGSADDRLSPEEVAAYVIANKLK